MDQLGRQFGYHRITIKRMYETILDKLSNKLKNNLCTSSTKYLSNNYILKYLFFPNHIGNKVKTLS